MIELIHLTNQWDIKKYLTRDHIYRTCYLTDDLYSEHVLKDGIAWFLIKEEEKEIGLLLLKEFSNLCVTPHGGIYKEYRGKETPRRVKEILSIIKEKGMVYVITVPSKYNKVISLMTKINCELKMVIPNGTINDNLLVFGEI